MAFREESILSLNRMLSIDLIELQKENKQPIDL